MAHGPRTAELLRRIDDAVRTGSDTLTIRNLTLTSLPELPAGLLSLDCSHNELKTLPNLPATLETLECINNILTELPDLPLTLRRLDCEGNKLIGLPALVHTSLMRINCSDNLLSVLPDLPPSLQILNCQSGFLRSLPALPPNLFELVCRWNNLTVLPNLPPALQRLYCSRNRLIRLPELPQTLTSLQCNNNRITELPALPPGLNDFSFVDNPIKRVTLPFPPSLHRLRMRQVFTNTNLYRPDVTLGQYPQALALALEARDLANGEVAGILRHRDKTKGLVEEGSALDRAMATGILPGQVGQFLTGDPNIIKGSEGEVKKSLRNLRGKLSGPGAARRRRRTKRSRK